MVLYKVHLAHWLLTHTASDKDVSAAAPLLEGEGSIAETSKPEPEADSESLSAAVAALPAPADKQLYAGRKGRSFFFGKQERCAHEAAHCDNRAGFKATADCAGIHRDQKTIINSSLVLL